MGEVKTDTDHWVRMNSADADLDALSRRRKESLRKIAAADKKYKAYVKAAG